LIDNIVVQSFVYFTLCDRGIFYELALFHQEHLRGFSIREKFIKGEGVRFLLWNIFNKNFDYQNIIFFPFILFRRYFFLFYYLKLDLFLSIILCKFFLILKPISI